MAKSMNTIRAELESSVERLNELNANNGGIKDTLKAQKEIDEKVNEYTAAARTEVFEKCRESPDPMLTAVTMLEFQTVGVKEEKQEEETAPPVYKVIPKARRIDLLKLENFCKGIGHDRQWNHAVMKLNFLLTAQKCRDLGIDPRAVNDSYAMSAIAKGYDLGENPTSNTKLLKALQTVVTAMIGESYKVTSHDVTYLTSVYSKKNRAALTLTCANHSTLRGLLAEICHRIVHNKAYDVIYKKTKEATAAPVEITKSAKEAPKPAARKTAKKTAKSAA